jgi:squalene synthase HpnD
VTGTPRTEGTPQPTASPESPPAPQRVAAGSSFYWAMRILPRGQREAMFEIYAFCRAVDDIADGPGSRLERSAGLQSWRRAIACCYQGTAPAELAGLAREIRTFGLHQEDFEAVIDGMQMDIDADICAPDWSTLDRFCDRVASAVGRLSVRVFGIEGQGGLDLAYHLGRGLQLTNILRDLDEDGAIGRLYLPDEALLDAGIPTRDVQQVLASPALNEACFEVARVAQTHLEQADEIMSRLPRARVRAPRIMAAAYQLILNGLVRRGFRAPRQRARASRLRLLGIVLSHSLA